MMLFIEKVVYVINHYDVLTLFYSPKNKTDWNVPSRLTQ